jgi:hypothetical protein
MTSPPEIALRLQVVKVSYPSLLLYEYFSLHEPDASVF